MAKSVVRALFAQATSLNLSAKKLKEVPLCISALKSLSVLHLNNNFLTALPAELLSLQHVSLFSFIRHDVVANTLFHPAWRFICN